MALITPVDRGVRRNGIQHQHGRTLQRENVWRWPWIFNFSIQKNFIDSATKYVEIVSAGTTKFSKNSQLI